MNSLLFFSISLVFIAKACMPRTPPFSLESCLLSKVKNWEQLSPALILSLYPNLVTTGQLQLTANYKKWSKDRRGYFIRCHSVRLLYVAAKKLLSCRVSVTEWSVLTQLSCLPTWQTALSPSHINHTLLVSIHFSGLSTFLWTERVFALLETIRFSVFKCNISPPKSSNIL